MSFFIHVSYTSHFGFDQIVSSYYSQIFWGRIFALTVFAIFSISLVHSIVILKTISASSTDQKISYSISLSSPLTQTPSLTSCIRTKRKIMKCALQLYSIMCINHVYFKQSKRLNYQSANGYLFNCAVICHVILSR